jgi:hypothetical protein
VAKFPLLCALALLLTAAAAGQQPLATSPTPQALEPGVIVPKVISATQLEQSYALYVPSKYSADKKWPIVYVFDPAARGSMPLELMKDAAERYGYIVVGSNNSRNGSWKLETDAAQTMYKDTHERLSIDDRRIYFAGFSGGARVASQLAQRCKCAAGVLLNGAGFSTGLGPSAEAIFPVFAAVGTFDFNYGELMELDAKLETLQFPHWLRRFEGPHEWAPKQVMDEAFAWFQLLAMRTGLTPRDDAFVAAQLAEAAERVRGLEQSGDSYTAWTECHQAMETFDKLADTAALQTRANILAKEKSVQEGPKHQKQLFEEQQRLQAPISSGFAALLQSDLNRDETRHNVEMQIVDLRDRAAHEKRPEKLLVEKRALAGILVEAMETGNQQLEAKELSHAQDFFELASDADPDSIWALTYLAAARAMSGNRKGTFEALRRAKEKTKDLAAFLGWMKNEPSFEKLRDTPQFQALLVP